MGDKKKSLKDLKDMDIKDIDLPEMKHTKKFLKELREFAMKGNIFDMAVGVIIGGAFGKIVTSLVNDIIMPLFGAIINNGKFSDLAIVLKPAEGDVAAVTLNYGNFIQTVVDFLIVAFCIFLFIRGIAKMKERIEKKKKKAAEAAAAAPAEPPKPSDEVLLLTEIRDLLKKQEEAK